MWLSQKKYTLRPSARDIRVARLRRQAEALRIRQLSTLLSCVVLTGVFVLIFTPAANGYSDSGDRQLITTRPAAGQPGVTRPQGLSASFKTAAAGTAKITKGSAKGSSAAGAAIPPKPAWTHLPLYVDPNNEATSYANANPAAANTPYIARMGQVPVSEWFGDWNANVTSDANAYVSAAAGAKSVPVLVLYNIPERDCGGYSTGGASGATGYDQWVQQVANGIGNRTAVVILEPDALGDLDCLSPSDGHYRLQALSKAVTILKANAGTSVYLDAGTPVWQSTATMASRLQAANVAQADGFSLNVSYFLPTAQNQTYGDQLSRLIGNKHYVIDTSRNGGNNNVTGMQCNPSFASFGSAPTTNIKDAVNDAFLWIKIPWESDGPCNGSPDPGVVYWSYAVQLAKNAGW